MSGNVATVEYICPLVNSGAINDLLKIRGMQMDHHEKALLVITWLLDENGKFAQRAGAPKSRENGKKTL